MSEDHLIRITEPVYGREGTLNTCIDRSFPKQEGGRQNFQALRSPALTASFLLTALSYLLLRLLSFWRINLGNFIYSRLYRKFPGISSSAHSSPASKMPKPQKGPPRATTACTACRSRKQKVCFYLSTYKQGTNLKCSVVAKSEDWKPFPKIKTNNPE